MSEGRRLIICEDSERTCTGCGGILKHAIDETPNDLGKMRQTKVFACVTCRRVFIEQHKEAA